MKWNIQDAGLGTLGLYDRARGAEKVELWLLLLRVRASDEEKKQMAFLSLAEGKLMAQ